MVAVCRRRAREDAALLRPALIGVIRQGDTALDDDELAALEAADPVALDDTIDRIVDGRPVVVALSRDGDGILASALVRNPGGHGTRHAAREALRALSAEIDLKVAALG